jgi:hypothetical protein
MLRAQWHYLCKRDVASPCRSRGREPQALASIQGIVLFRKAVAHCKSAIAPAGLRVERPSNAASARESHQRLRQREPQALAAFQGIALFGKAAAHWKSTIAPARLRVERPSSAASARGSRQRLRPREPQALAAHRGAVFSRKAAAHWKSTIAPAGLRVERPSNAASARESHQRLRQHEPQALAAFQGIVLFGKAAAHWKSTIAPARFVVERPSNAASARESHQRLRQSIDGISDPGTTKPKGHAPLPPTISIELKDPC